VTGSRLEPDEGSDPEASTEPHLTTGPDEKQAAE